MIGFTKGNVMISFYPSSPSCSSSTSLSTSVFGVEDQGRGKGSDEGKRGPRAAALRSQRCRLARSVGVSELAWSRSCERGPGLWAAGGQLGLSLSSSPLAPLSHREGSLPPPDPGRWRQTQGGGVSVETGSQATGGFWRKVGSHRPPSPAFLPDSPPLSGRYGGGGGRGGLAWCFGTAAAGAGPAWNAGTGSAPGLLWKLAAGDGGGGDSQRAPGGRSGGGGQTLAHSQAQDARSLSARAIAGGGSRRVRTRGERGAGGSGGVGSPGEEEMGETSQTRPAPGFWPGSDAAPSAPGSLRPWRRAGRGRGRARGWVRLTVWGSGSTGLRPWWRLPGPPPPRFRAVAPRALSFGRLLHSGRGRALRARGGRQPGAVRERPRQVR